MAIDPQSPSKMPATPGTANISFPKVSSFRPKADPFASYFPEDTSTARPLSATILKPQIEVYSLLRDIQNFPKFFENLEKVEESGATRANWYFRDGRDKSTAMSVPMTLTGDRTNELLVWKAEDKAGFGYTVAIALEPAQAGRGTVVRLKVAYDSVIGDTVAMVEKLFGADAELLSKKNLQRFKAFCETGHVPTIEGQSSGRDEDKDSTDYPPGHNTNAGLKH